MLSQMRTHTVSSLVHCILSHHFVTRSRVNHAGFDDVKKKLHDNDCHHQKGGECECMNT